MRMAFRLAPTASPVRARPVKNRDYLAFVHLLPCVLSLTRPVEAAHISFARPDLGHYGRGKGTKTSDRWVLPLSPAYHRIQHGMNEQRFWQTSNVDPHQLCLVLWGLFSEHGWDAEEMCRDIIWNRQQRL